jgi:hypothetical protein
VRQAGRYPGATAEKAVPSLLQQSAERYGCLHPHDDGRLRFRKANLAKVALDYPKKRKS